METVDIEVKMPDIGLEEVEVIEILVQINEKISLEQGLIVVEGEKTSLEVPSPICGIVKNIHVKIGDKVKTSSVLMNCKINDNIKKENIKKIIKKEKKENFIKCDVNLKPNTFVNKNTFIHATPVIRRLARNLNINLYDVTGTGPKNRILKEDIELYKKSSKADVLEKENIMTTFYHSDKLAIKEIPISSLQKITGDNLYQNWINIPHVTQFNEADITDLEKFRKEYNFKNQNKKKLINKITILVFIIKVVARALEKFPIFNSSLDKNNNKIVLKKYINIGIAVDVGDGLLVPVLKHVNEKNIQQLSSELIFISEKARKKNLNMSDMERGCFTISNLGGIGGSWFSPIINAPEVAILGVSKSQTKPLWNGKEFIPSLMLPLSLSYDHRVINGADAARFIVFISKLLSDIRLLIM